MLSFASTSKNATIPMTVPNAPQTAEACFSRWVAAVQFVAARGDVRGDPCVATIHRHPATSALRATAGDDVEPTRAFKAAESFTRGESPADVRDNSTPLSRTSGG